MDDLEVPMGTHLVGKPTYWLLTIQKSLPKKIEGLIQNHPKSMCCLLPILLGNLCVVQKSMGLFSQRSDEQGPTGSMGSTEARFFFATMGGATLNNPKWLYNVIYIEWASALVPPTPLFGGSCREREREREKEREFIR